MTTEFITHRSAFIIRSAVGVVLILALAAANLVHCSPLTGEYQTADGRRLTASRESSAVSGKPLAPSLAPLEQLVHPLGSQGNRAMRWGSLVGVAGGMALTSTLNANRQSDFKQITAGLGTWLASMLVGVLIGHSRDPIVTRVTYPPELQLVLSFAGQDNTQNSEKGIVKSESLRTPTGVEAGKLLIDVRNVGKGRAVKARLELAVLKPGVTTMTCYQGATLLGDIESGASRRAAIDVSTCNMPPGREFTVGVTCSYETQWGVQDEKTGSIELNSASMGKP